MATDPPMSSVQELRGWPLFLLGLVLFLLGPAIYAVQLKALGQTKMPWLMLILTAVGVVLMAGSLTRQFTILRSVGVAIFLLLTIAEWVFFLVIARTPTYAGPERGSPLPNFETTLAGGKTFSNRDLPGDGATVILFFRGHW